MQDKNSEQTPSSPPPVPQSSPPHETPKATPTPIPRPSPALKPKSVDTPIKIQSPSLNHSPKAPSSVNNSPLLRKSLTPKSLTPNLAPKFVKNPQENSTNASKPKSTFVNVPPEELSVPVAIPEDLGDLVFESSSLGSVALDDKCDLEVIIDKQGTPKIQIIPARIRKKGHVEDVDGLYEENAISASDDDQGASLLQLGGETEEVITNNESSFFILIQILLPFIVAGLGMVGAGIVLDKVQHWPVFVSVTELFIMVPALLGLKGNLEMTLASRLSTHANMGHLDGGDACSSMIIGNLALIQCQAIVVGFLASVAAVVMGWIPNGAFNILHTLLLCGSALVTASFASFILGVIMVGVILLSRKCHINPDNVATPIAASLGDLITLGLLSWISSLLFQAKDDDLWLAPLIVVGYLVSLPLWIWLASRNKYTKEVLYSGWTPVISAMMISSLGGVILDHAVASFKGIAVYQPVINGVGGNLVAVQASRISTALHQSSPLGKLPRSIETACVSPCNAFFAPGGHARTARVLLLLVVPGHLIFIYSISYLKAGHTSLTPVFIVMYLLAAFVQVLTLLYIAAVMVHFMWKASIDPDNSAIPYLTALGDLIGTGLLAISFYLLWSMGDRDSDVGD